MEIFKAIFEIIKTIAIVLYDVSIYKICTINDIPIFGAYPLGIIVVYVFRKYIYRNEIEQGEEFTRTNGSMENAEYKTKKKILNDYPQSDFTTERWEDKHGDYWIIKVANMLYESIFVPMKEDDDSYLDKKQKDKYKE